MKKVIVIILALVIFTTGVSFAQGVKINNNQNGFSVTMNGKKIVIDSRKRAGYSFGYTIRGQKEMVISYSKSGSTHKNGMVVIQNGRVIFDSEKSKNKYTKAVINDPDGYTNVRSGPSKKYKVIEKILDNHVFAVTNWGKWCKVITPTGEDGYMHSSRVKKIGSSRQTAHSSQTNNRSQSNVDSQAYAVARNFFNSLASRDMNTAIGLCDVSIRDDWGRTYTPRQACYSFASEMDSKYRLSRLFRRESYPGIWFLIYRQDRIAGVAFCMHKIGGRWLIFRMDNRYLVQDAPK